MSQIETGFGQTTNTQQDAMFHDLKGCDIINDLTVLCDCLVSIGGILAAEYITANLIRTLADWQGIKAKQIFSRHFQLYDRQGELIMSAKSVLPHSASESFAAIQVYLSVQES